MNEHRALLIPGWMSRVKNYGLGEGLDIWKNFGDPTARLDADYLVGHSLGCHYALLNWQANRNAKLILVNPPLMKRSQIDWLTRWLRYKTKEGLGVSFEDVLFADIWHGLHKCYRLFRSDFVKIIREIPRADLVIVRGEHDDYFGDREVAEFARKENIKLVEVKSSGHNWDESIKREVQKLIV